MKLYYGQFDYDSYEAILKILRVNEAEDNETIIHYFDDAKGGIGGINKRLMDSEQYDDLYEGNRYFYCSTDRDAVMNWIIAKKASEVDKLQTKIAILGQPIIVLGNDD